MIGSDEKEISHIKILDGNDNPYKDQGEEEEEEKNILGLNFDSLSKNKSQPFVDLDQQLLERDSSLEGQQIQN